MCKAFAGSGRLSGQTFCRPKPALQRRWVKLRGSWAHLIVLRWVTRAFRQRGDSHVDIVRHRGRRSGARVSGRLLHAKPKIGFFSVRRVMQAVARAGNHTCIELSSALSTRARFGPFSAAISTSSSFSRSCRGAIADLHALAEFCFSGRPSIDQAPSLHAPLKPNALGRWGILRINKFFSPSRCTRTLTARAPPTPLSTWSSARPRAAAPTPRR
eukprot:scaffold19736_cov112-Isochrysis_galbana.AAC.2